jgi:hypothetical protein
VYWPKCLQFFRVDLPSTDRTATEIATYIPSVRVLKLKSCHYNVVSRISGKPVQVERWSTRAEEYFRSEQLEAQGCDEDLLYKYSSAQWIDENF